MSQKKKLIIIIGLALIVIAIGVIVALAVNRKDNSKLGDSNTTNTQQDQEKDALLGETFTSAQTGVSMRLPKGWETAPASADSPDSLTKLRQVQTTSGSAPANGELIARRSNASMDDIVRGYLEAAINIDVTSKLVDNQDVVIGDRVFRLLSHDIPGPNNQSARITQYIYYKDGVYYIVAFTMLSSEWNAQQPGIEASVESLTTP